MNDEDRTTDQQPPAPEPAQGRAKLTRRRSEGMLAGVAAGLGRHFDVDPVIFRIGFGVSLFFGGFGLLAYVALALFLPDESGKTAVKSSRLALVAAVVLIGLVLVPAIGWSVFWEGDGWGHWGALWLVIPVAIAIGAYALLRDRDETSSAGSTERRIESSPASWGRVIAAIFIAGAAVAGFFAIALGGAIATGFGHGTIAAILVIVAGVLIAAGAFSGALRWLIVPALALATGVGVAAAADLELEGGIGARQHVPLNAEAIPDDGYDLAMGKLDVDLRQLEWRPGAVIPVDVKVGMGQLTVAVPEDVCVEADARATAGSLQVAGERQEGFDVSSDQGTGSTATPRAVIDAEVQFGELRIVNDDAFDADDHHFRFHDDTAAAYREAQERACAG